MADEADKAQEDLDREEEAQIRRRENTPKYEIPEGVPGDCDLCGEWFGRLVEGACVPCRTKHKL